MQTNFKTTKNMKTLTKEMVTFTIQCEPELIPVYEALSEEQTGTDSHKEYIDKVIKDDGANPWLWCSVAVVAKFHGLMGYAHLGSCAYESEEDFIKGDYYEQMQEEALEDLQKQVDELCTALTE